MRNDEWMNGRLKQRESQEEGKSKEI